MLVLSRHVGQSIKIGHDITITIIDHKSDGEIKIGIDAPKDTPVYREEVYQAIRRQEQQ